MHTRLTILALTLAAAATLGAAPPKRKTMELKRWPTANTVETVYEDRVEIRDGRGSVALAPARPSVAVVTSGWSVAWEKPFAREAFTTVSIGAWEGASGARVIATGGESPTLRDLDGNPVLDPMPRMQARGRVFVDAAKERVFVSNDGVSQLAGGEVTFLLPAPGFVTSLLVSGDRLLAWGSRTDQHPHGGTVTREAIVAVHDLAKPDAHVPKVHVMGVSALAVDAMPETIAFVIPDEIHLLPWDFSKGRVLVPKEKFTPLSVSFDSAGHLHVVAAVDKHVELWIVQADGRRVVRTRLPVERLPDTPDTWQTADIHLAAPPMITKDRVYVHFGRRDPKSTGYASVLVALTPSGDVAWQRVVSGGAVATGDGRVLATDGNRILSLDAAGAELVLHDAGEPIVTPPTIVRGDAIAFATAKKLVMLRAR